MEKVKGNTPIAKYGPDEKRKAQNKVVEMLLPGLRRAAIYLMDLSGLAAKW